ncbi:hypothetical protein [Streptomyces silvensis]|uniref:hypothetical protein n=1 Tax=Streptomyces silvensis TaxID=1765722 RepID=UPI0007C6C390|nr:hypothetical protein [Streptomyces silvensis]
MSGKEVAKRDSAEVDPRTLAAEARKADVLELEDILDEGEELLAARGAAYAREHKRIEGVQVSLVKNLATVCIALRHHHDDYRGNSRAYRDVVTEMYNRAGLTGDERERMTQRVRYHIGNGLRRFLTPRELTSVNLLPESPLERNQDARATNQVMLKALRTSADAERVPEQAKPSKRAPAKGVVDTERVETVQRTLLGRELKATADSLRLAHAAQELVSQLSDDSIGDMTDGQRSKLDEELKTLESRVRQLRRKLKAAPKG